MDFDDECADRAGVLPTDREAFQGFLPTHRWMVEEELRRSVREILGDAKPYSIEDRLRPFFPSTSANYVASRSHGGAVGYLLDEGASLLEGLRRPGGYLRLSSAARDGKYYTVLEGEDLLSEAFKELWRRLLHRAASEQFDVAPVGLPEALKVRVITKGNPSAQTVMKPLQKYLFRALSQHNVFYSLWKGGRLDPDFLERQLGVLREDQKWTSGDYEAATDNLHSWVSETIWDEVSSVLGLFPEERDIGRRLLTGHLILGKPQRRGQLMGSIISFPILCIANFALCRKVVEVDSSLCKGKFRPQRIPLDRWQGLINGDDCVFKTTKFGHWFWSRWGNRFFGLKESVGKTYHSDEFIEMNSRLFAYCKSAEEALGNAYSFVKPDGSTVARFHHFVRTPLINMGLVAGLKRSGVSVDKSDLMVGSGGMAGEWSIGARERQLLAETVAGPNGGFGEEAVALVTHLFVNKHRSVLEGTGLPWYVPESFGGLGLVGLPSKLDLQICRTIAQRDIHIVRSAGGDWKCWDRASKRLQPDAFARRILTRSEEREASAVMSTLVIDCLFDSNLALGDLFVTERAAKMAALNVNRQLWTTLLHSGNLLPFGWSIRADHVSLAEEASEEVTFRKLSEEVDYRGARPYVITYHSLEDVSRLVSTWGVKTAIPAESALRAYH